MNSDRRNLPHPKDGGVPAGIGFGPTRVAAPECVRCWSDALTHRAMTGRGSKQLLASGRRAEGATHLQRAVAFDRKVGASAYLREAEVLLAATA